MQRPMPGRPSPFGTAQAGLDAPLHETVLGPDDRVAVGDTTADPWRMIGQVTASTAAGTFIGTGFLVGPFHVLTAGHVVHNAAYGGDGWAQTVTVTLGRNGSVAPFGVATATDLRAPAEWVSGAAFAEDWALITLDRSLGTALGAFALGGPEAPEAAAGLSVTLAGYPGDLAGARGLFAAAGEIDIATADNLFYDGTLDTAGGMSGSPVWQTFTGSGERIALGVHTSGAADPDAANAFNAGVRLTAEKIGLIDEWIGSDVALSPPTDLPDPADADSVFGASTAVLAGALVPGGDATLSVDIRNLGTAAAEAGVTAYLSVNGVISVHDIAVGATTVSDLAPFETRRVELAVSVPAELSPGDYRLGWLIDPDGALTEFEESNNTGLLAAPVTVGPAPDLVAEGLSLGTTEWSAGQVVTAAWTVRNAGSTAAPPTTSGLYASTDPEVTTDDRLLLVADVPILAAGGQSIRSGSVTVPADLAGQALWIAAVADSEGTVAEAEETANATAAQAVSVSPAGVLRTGGPAADGLAGGVGDDTLSGFDGADTLSGLGGADSLDGGGDDDRLNGDAGADVLLGGPGFDTLRGHDGPDSLTGDLGDGIAGQGDLAFGGSGADTLLGEGGPDTLYGEAGDDRLEGGPGFDVLNGNAGNDTLLGGDLRDTLDGEDGADSLNGGEGNDALWGGPGEDTIFGGAGPDFADGGTEADRIDGGAEDDILLGGSGDDTLTGGSGIDRLLGGAGADSLAGGSGGDRLFGEDGDDTIEGGAGDDLIFGNAGDDLATGGDGDDSLVGEGGSDTLSGGDGGDLVAGREGPDSLTGGPGDDIVDGGSEDDTLAGGDGADAVYGREGGDSLSAGPGDDFAAGGAGDDTLAGGPGADRLAGDSGTDRFEFAAGDGADHVFDLEPGLETVAISGGVATFDDLVITASPEGWAMVAYGADPGDTLTLQGVAPGDLSDDGTFEFL